MFCPNCQASLPDIARFCRECGSPVTAYAPPEGFEIDRSSLLFYREDGIGTDGRTKYLTWFYPDTGEYEQVGYPVERSPQDETDSLPEPEPENMSESDTEPVTEPPSISDTEAVTKSAPILDTHTEPVTEPAPISDTHTEPVTEPAPISDTHTEMVTEPAPISDMEPVTESTPISDTEAVTEPTPTAITGWDTEPVWTENPVWAYDQAQSPQDQSPPVLSPQVQPPEGFLYDQSSGLYYISTPGNDLTTNAAGNWYTWFYPDTGEFKQVFYPFD